jgi:superfamily I DNA/RNA helicase/PHP family Zn ribbon phosphoesterase
MRIIADLHIHSRFSRATSSRLTPAYLDRWARIKGIGLLGTGDCTHPRWLAELRETLEEGEEGFYTLKKPVRAAFEAGPALAEGLPGVSGGNEDAPRFVLSGEISTIYKKGDKTRKVHHVVLLPDFKSAAAFQSRLERIGNIGSDGRPILGIDSRDLLAMLLDTGGGAQLIPAHIWTPWFSALGAKSGFDSIDACYGDLSPHISAVETGLSSNPPMNWALSSLDRFSIISNSDAHSPEKMGREATVFEMPRSFSGLCRALRPGEPRRDSTRDGAGSSAGAEDPRIEDPRIAETIEFFPQEGKYHYDGHRKCGVWLSPGGARASGGLCPVCGKPLTRGVMGRVLELADRPVDETEAFRESPAPLKTNRRPYRSLIPLRELLGELLQTGSASKKAGALYGMLIEKTGSELSLLMDRTLPEIEKIRCPGLSGELLAQAICRMRAGEVSISPGYDGEYGVIRAFPPGGLPEPGGADLFGDLAPPVPPAMPGKPPPAGRGKARLPSPEPVRPPPEKTEAPAPEVSPAWRFHPEQERALSYDGQYAMIIAGPGTGKTALLAARIARLIREGAGPASVLALSFTVKAAAELGERVRAALEGGAFGPQAGGGKTGAAQADSPLGTGGVTAATFHSFCCSLLREQPAESGVPQNFRIIGEEEREGLLREIAGEGKKGGTGYQRLGRYIEERKRLLLLPGENAPRQPLVQNPETPPADPAAEGLYGLYRDRLRRSELLDFEDLVAGTVRLLAGKEEILAEYRRRYRFIFVDEYQDLNFAQYALIRLLAPPGKAPASPAEPLREEPGPSLWVIGDPNQAIYGFRGSDKRFIDRFLEDYPGAGRFRLSRSFRCAVPIINAAGRLMDTRLEGTEGGTSLFREEYPTEKAEAEGIARRISGLIGGTTFFAMDSGAGREDPSPEQGRESAPEASGLGDCAILLRTAALAAPIVKALGDHGIPFDLTGEKPWWEEEPARSLLDYLREAPRQKEDGPFPPDITPLEAVRTAWERLNREGAKGRRKKGETPPCPERLLNFAALYEKLPAMLDTLSVSAAGEAPEIKREGVKIMTIHAAKGLEFGHVFVAALEEGLLPFTLYERPGQKTPENAPEPRVEEERRLLYVAMTRARRGLYLSWARSRNLRGRVLRGGPSRFLEDLETLIPMAKNQDQNPNRKKRETQPGLFDPIRPL